MKRKILFILAYVLLIGSYGGYRYLNSREVENGALPEIKVPKGTIKVSCKADDDKILEDVKAKDKEDGDITDQLFIENMSAFGEGNIRQVTIGVFDKDDNYVSTTRSIKYKNYKAPVISLKKALVYDWVRSKAQFADYVTAKSSVDGNISSNVTVNREYTRNKSHYVEFSVVDSTGTETIQAFKALQNDRELKLDIILRKYVVRIKKGETISPMKYVKHIEMNEMNYDDLKSDIKVKTDFVENQEGQFEYIYRLKTDNDDYGLTKLVVIVS